MRGKNARELQPSSDVNLLLEFLEMRFNVPDDIGQRVERCDDEEQIKTWARRVPTATSVDEVFSL